MTYFSAARVPNQRCAVRVTENPTHYDACSSSPTYPNPSSTKCTQVSIASAPIPSTCAGGDACPAEDAGCWVQPYSGDRTYNYDEAADTYRRMRLDGWIKSGPTCDKPYEYLAPCPTAKCRTGEMRSLCYQQPASVRCHLAALPLLI